MNEYRSTDKILMLDKTLKTVNIERNAEKLLIRIYHKFIDNSALDSVKGLSGSESLFPVLRQGLHY